MFAAMARVHASADHALEELDAVAAGDHVASRDDVRGSATGMKFGAGRARIHA